MKSAQTSFQTNLRKFAFSAAIFVLIIAASCLPALPEAERHVAAPVFSPAGGVFSDDQNITISCSTAGATIYYTTDSSIPTPSSNVYSGPIQVIGSGTIKTIIALAIKNGIESTLASAVFTISYQITAPQFSHAGGTYSDDLNVIITCPTNGAMIRYTLDESVPNSMSSEYTGAIPISGHGTTITLKAIASKGGVDSNISSAIFTINYQILPPWFSPIGGTYPADRNVTITCPTSGATVYYTTDGVTIPTTSSNVFSGAILIAGDETTKIIKAIAYKGGAYSDLVEATFTIYYPQVSEPQFSPAAGTYYLGQSIRLSSATPNATIYYTIDGSTPTTLSSIYTSPISVPNEGTKTIKALAVKTGKTNSSIINAAYMIIPNNAPEWARTTDSGFCDSAYNGVVLDSQGNIYAVGSINCAISHGFGNGVSTQGVSTENLVLVKYDLAGNAQWARTVYSGSGVSRYNSVAVDSMDNVYVAGFISGSGIYGLGNDVFVQGISSEKNLVLVKYNPNGMTQWAKTVTTGIGQSYLTSLTIDTSDNIYVAGGMSEHDLGNGVTIQGGASIVRYNSEGIAQWARSVISHPSVSVFNSVTCDNMGNVIAAGTILGSGSFSFGDGVSAQGSSSSSYNVVLVKYNSVGTVLWAQTTYAGSAESIYDSVAVDSSGNIIAAGHIYQTNEYGFGNGVTAQGADSINIILVKYDFMGNAQWARTMYAGYGWSQLKTVAVDETSNIYVGGYATGDSVKNFGNGVAIRTSGDPDSALLIKYDTLGNTQWAQSTTRDIAKYKSLVLDNLTNIYAVGEIWWGPCEFGNGISAQGIYIQENIIIIKY